MLAIKYSLAQRQLFYFPKKKKYIELAYGIQSAISCSSLNVSEPVWVITKMKNEAEDITGPFSSVILQTSANT